MKTTKVKKLTKKEEKEIKQAIEVAKFVNQKYRNTMKKLAYE